MRKLAPMFVMTSIVALAAGNALANNTKSTSYNSTVSSPTVDNNTRSPQGLSYSDKSNTSPGTNAIMDGKSKPMTTAQDQALQKTKKKTHKAKAKLASRSGTTDHKDTSMAANPPVNTTGADAANSVTGKSLGK